MVWNAQCEFSASSCAALPSGLRLLGDICTTASQQIHIMLVASGMICILFPDKFLHSPDSNNEMHFFQQTGSPIYRLFLTEILQIQL